MNAIEVSKKYIQFGRKALPLAVSLGSIAAVAVLAQSNGPANKRAAVENSAPVASESPAPAAASHVTVNGQEMPANPDGSVNVSLPSSETKVTSSEVDGTNVVTTESHHSSSTAGKSSNVNVNVDSTTNGGDNSGSTQVYGFNANNNGSSSSFSSTNVFSSGSSSIHTTSP